MTDDIEAIICNVLAQYPVKKAAMFGSAARKKMTSSSDYPVKRLLCLDRQRERK